MTICSPMAKGLRDRYEAAMERYAFQDALAEVFKVVARGQQVYRRDRPLGAGQGHGGQRRPAGPRCMYNLLETTRICGVLLTPFMPESMTQAVCPDRRGRGRPDLGERRRMGRPVPDRQRHQGREPLPPRGRGARPSPSWRPPPRPPRRPPCPAVEVEPQTEEKVDFDTFCKSDFRAVKVKDCQAVKKSNKLLCFTLDDGTGTDRQILSGIATSITSPRNWSARRLVAIVNLPPRKMMGLESNGMLISAVHTEHGEEKLHLIMVDDAIPAGAKLG